MKKLFITSVRDFEKGTMGTVDMMEVPVPEPGPEEIRIKIAYASICGSDSHILSGNLGELAETTKSMLPMSLGHELSGTIDKAGTKARELGFKEGNKVVCNYAKYCYSCSACRSGKENFCKNLQFSMDGMAEYACYHMTQVHKLSDDYDLLEASLIEPLTVAIGAVEQAKVSLGKSVAVMGAGGIGLMIVQLARLAGASHITVFDIVEDKCNLAMKLGADSAFDPNSESAMEKAMACVDGMGYDCVLEGTGVMSAAKMTLDLLAPDGDCVYYAMYGANPVLDVNVFNHFYWNQKHLHGFKMGAGLFPKAIKTAKRLDLKTLIQKVYPFNEYKKAFDDQLSKRYAKIVMKMEE